MKLNRIKTVNTQTLSVQLQVIAVKSKPMLANKFISIQFNRWGILWKAKLCNQLFSTVFRLNTFNMAGSSTGAVVCSDKWNALRYLLSHKLDFYFLQLWKSVLWRLFSSLFDALFMETFGVCEHNWSFVKLRSVHAHIVRNFDTDLAFYHVSSSLPVLPWFTKCI